MKTESTVMPQSPYEIEGDGDTVDVLFFENVKEIPPDEEDGQNRYEYDMYRLTGIRNRPSLSQAIEANLDDWISLARSKCAPSSPLPSLEDRVTAAEDAIFALAMGGI